MSPRQKLIEACNGLTDCPYSDDAFAAVLQAALEIPFDDKAWEKVSVATSATVGEITGCVNSIVADLPEASEVTAKAF